MIIEYSKYGKAIGDDECLDIFLDELANGTEIIKVSTANIIHVSRVLIAIGRIDVDDISYMFKVGDTYKKLLPDKNGRISEWPIGFCDHFDRWLEALILPGEMPDGGWDNYLRTGMPKILPVACEGER
jgi:hypothetical protein